MKKDFTIDMDDQEKHQELEHKDEPLMKMGKYRVDKLIGSGGMGEVYLAYDETLQRYVALKLIKGEDKQTVSRFMIEARAQAKVEHEHVCKIYEVGEFQGRPFIAMQFIEGETLLDAACSMSLEQKIKLICEVAEALHAAHKEGLIHRDIKPANIMVERTDTGSWKPYIMDFGLAREAGSAGLTSMGAVMGTPAYMAPEQSRGEIDKLDRRTDVYSLGATLYEILAGQPPFLGESSVSILMKVVSEEPSALRKLDSHVPEDVETIVMKCLEKEPGRRYESARALAEDLHRYLEGEPILARKASLSYRLLKQARKHRVAVLTGSVMLVILLVMLGLLIRSRMIAAEQLRIANQFGQEVKELEIFVQRAYLLPLHNVSYVRKTVDAKMNWIRTNMKKLGSLTEGPGHYALGRGYLAIHEYKPALQELDLAWNHSGYKEPEVADAFGLTLAELYREKMEEAERIQNKEMREGKKKELDKQFRLPAMKYIEQGRRSGIAESEYSILLLAYLAQNFNEVIGKSGSITGTAPWLYEAEELKGDAYRAMANRARGEGKSEEAMKLYEQAENSYLQATLKGSSDPSTYERLCGLQNDVMWIKSYQVGGSITDGFAAAIKSCDDALKADPHRELAHGQKIVAYTRMAAYQNEHGGDPRQYLQKAIASGQLALRIDPNDEVTYRSIGSAYYYYGYYERMTGQNPIESFSKAIESQKKAVTINPNYFLSYNNMGNIYGLQAEYEISRGMDPRKSFEESLNSYLNVIRINPNYSFVYSNLGVTYYDKGRWELDRGIDPTLSMNKAIESNDSAIRLNPNFAASYNNRGNAYLSLAEYAHVRQLDPLPMLNKAIENYQQALSIDPEYAMSMGNLGGTLALQAEYEITHQRVPTEALVRARGFLQKAVDLYPNDFYSYNSFGRIEMMSGRWEMTQNKSPVASFNKARAWLQKSMKSNPEEAESSLYMAQTCRWEAAWNTKNKRPAGEILDAGLAHADKAFTLNPQKADALIIKSILLKKKAEQESDPLRQQSLRQQAEQLLIQSRKLNPLMTEANY